MPRIRSVLPGQWNDEDFVECSFPARLLAIAVRNFADDQGVFEWKMKTLKMQCFPADSIDLEPLFEELVAANIVKRFRVDGRDYGAIRNFRVFQRPKKPNTTYPLPDEFRNYVALDGKKSGIEVLSSDDSSELEALEDEAVRKQFGTGSEIAPQREEVVSRRLEVKKESRQLANEAQASFWKIYPPRTGSKGTTKANSILAKLLAKGTPLDDILNGVRAYRRALAAENKLGTEFVAMAQTWLNQRRWEDYGPVAAPQQASRKLNQALGDSMTDRLISNGLLFFNEESKWLEWTDKGLASPEYQNITRAQ